MAQLRMFAEVENQKDVVYTPDEIACQMVKHFQPSGRILEPAKGDGVFLRHLPTAEYCEIKEGKDFFAWHEKVDWCFGNPPYSILSEWIEHSFEVANDIVYLVPLHKVLSVWGTLRTILKHGGFVEVLIFGAGNAIGFDFGYAVGAVHLRKGWHGGTRISYTPPNTACTGLAGFSASPSESTLEGFTAHGHFPTPPANQ